MILPAFYYRFEYDQEADDSSDEPRYAHPISDPLPLREVNDTKETIVNWEGGQTLVHAIDRADVNRHPHRLPHDNSRIWAKHALLFISSLFSMSQVLLYLFSSFHHFHLPLASLTYTSI
jgi:hypothetical protein